MSLLDVLHTAVKIIDNVTKPIQTEVQYRHCLNPDIDGYGTKDLAPAVGLKAVVDFKMQQVRTQQGELVVSQCAITIVDVAALAAASNNEGLSVHDQIVFPDGRTGPLLNVGGYMDPGTGQPVATDTWL